MDSNMRTLIATSVLVVVAIVNATVASAVTLPKKRYPRENLACIQKKDGTPRIMCLCAHNGIMDDPANGGPVLYHSLCTPASNNLQTRCQYQLECYTGDPVPPSDPLGEPPPDLVIMGPPYQW